MPAAPSVSIVRAALPAFEGQATPPANCSTSTGFPCAKLTSSVVSCSATATFNGPNGSQDSGPCLIGVLRCTGSCTAASLPVQTGTPPQTLVGNATWKVLTSTLAQSAFTATYYDNASLAYSTTYTYALVAEYSGSGGGVWSAYSSPFQLVFGTAPTAPAGIPATPGGTAVTQ